MHEGARSRGMGRGEEDILRGGTYGMFSVIKSFMIMMFLAYYVLGKRR